MKQALQLRLSQHLTLTPQLQQSIRLLQLSTLELEQEIEQIMVDNPLLERDDGPAFAGSDAPATESLPDAFGPQGADAPSDWSDKEFSERTLAAAHAASAMKMTTILPGGSRRRPPRCANT